MGRASTRLHSGLPGRGRPDSGSPGGTALDIALPNRGLPGARDPLAEARDRFLHAEPVDRKIVREPILASWWRSRDWRIAANRLDLSYLGAPDLDTTLARCRSAGVRVLEDTLTDYHAYHSKLVFVCDPDGTMIELIEIPGDPYTPFGTPYAAPT